MSTSPAIKPEQSTPQSTPHWFVPVLSVFLLIFIAIAGFLAYQNIQLQKQIKILQTTPSSPSLTIPVVNNQCVEKTSLDCANMVELTFECSDEYQSWALTNCPDWNDKVYCSNPRPEICTLECTYPPNQSPYLCGSDGKSYCTVCQACSNKDVIWYETKTSSCDFLPD